MKAGSGGLMSVDEDSDCRVRRAVMEHYEGKSCLHKLHRII